MVLKERWCCTFSLAYFLSFFLSLSASLAHVPSHFSLLFSLALSLVSLPIQNQCSTSVLIAVCRGSVM